LVRKPLGKRALGRPRCRFENNIKMDYKARKLGAWTELIWHRKEQMADTCEYRNEPSGSIKCREFLN